MRHIAAMALVLGLGFAASGVPAFAESENGGATCYVNGVAASCVQPARLTLDTGSDAGSVAGPTVPNQNPFFGGDKD